MQVGVQIVLSGWVGKQFYRQKCKTLIQDFYDPNPPQAEHRVLHQ